MRVVGSFPCTNAFGHGRADQGMARARPAELEGRWAAARQISLFAHARRVTTLLLPVPGSGCWTPRCGQGKRCRPASRRLGTLRTTCEVDSVVISRTSTTGAGELTMQVVP